MQSELTLISTLAAGLGLGLVLGFIAIRLKIPALVGYLVSGVVLGSFAPETFADAHIAAQFAELGVMLLMFGVGLHFSFGDLLSVRKIAVPGAIAKIIVATGMGFLLGWFWGWGIGGSLVFGLSLSVASTVVLLRQLESLNALTSFEGRISLGWLVVEDLFMVLILVLLPPFAQILSTSGPSIIWFGSEGLLASVSLTFGKILAFIFIMIWGGSRIIPWLLWQVAKTGSRELFTLFVVAAAIVISFGAGMLFNVSFALGAFFAGMVIRKSHLSFRAAADSLPLRDAFSVLFFVSVGMLLNPRIFIEHPIKVLATLFIIIIGKSLASFIIVLLFRYPVLTAISVSASLAQIGEFSFILAGAGLKLGLLNSEAESLILAGAILSIGLNPLIFKSIQPLANWFKGQSAIPRILQRVTDPLSILPASVESKQVTGHIILVGFGRVGKKIAENLSRAGIGYVVADQNREIVERLRAEGNKAVAGNAADPAILIQAHVTRAKALVLALPEPLDVRKIIEIARALNPKIITMVRSHHAEEALYLSEELTAKVFLGEEELANNMSEYLVKKVMGEIPGKAT